MKTLALTLGMIGIAAADDLRLTVHMIAMEPGKLIGLLDDAGGVSIGKAREMVKAGEARLFDTMMLRGKEGERVSLESQAEVIYPSEYEPPDLPNSKDFQEKIDRRMEGWGKAFSIMPLTGAGTFFETRATGEELEISRQDMAESPWFLSIDRYARDQVFLELSGLNGEKFQDRFPEFEKLAIRGSVHPDGWQCAGILTKPGDSGEPGEKIVVFARTERIIIGE